VPVTMFVGGLSRSTSSRRLLRFFAGVGAVRSASVVMHRDTGRSHGFGFVEMATAGQANDARARLNGRDLDGCRIVVEAARPEIRAGGGSQGGGEIDRSERGDPRDQDPSGRSAEPVAGRSAGLAPDSRSSCR
jgi:RNA recognition motif-containing protein